MIKSLVFPLALILVGCNKSNVPSPTTVHASETVEKSRWTKTEIPLRVFHDEGRWASASAEGFWQATSSSKDMQLMYPIAVKIMCDQQQKICREADAIVEFGMILRSEIVEYDVVSWKSTGIVADDTDEGECGIGHRLALDFQSNSVTVTDYPKKIVSSAKCKALQQANSYSLHGGQLQLYPPAPWDPLEVKK